MARIKTDLADGQSVTITRGGATKRTHHSHDGMLTVRNDEADEVLAYLGAQGIKASMEYGSTDEPDDTTSPPDLPTPPPLS